MEKGEKKYNMPSHLSLSLSTKAIVVLNLISYNIMVITYNILYSERPKSVVGLCICRTTKLIFGWFIVSL